MPTSLDPGDAPVALVAVTDDMSDDLQRAGLAAPLPTLRGAIVDAAIVVGTDAATIVTLMQTPDAIRAFAGWLHGRFAQHGDSIRLQGRRNGVTVTLQVEGPAPVETIARR
jgi:hypothetical protein